MELGLQAGVVPIPAYLQNSNNFALDVSILQQTLEKARANKINVKALLISSPCNPLGVVYTKQELRDMYRWTKENNIHFIVDEIYALSSFFKSKPFTSISSVLEEMGESFGDTVHEVWSFSKDFSLSGFRVGMVYTENKAVLNAFHQQFFFYLASNHTQYILHQILSDETFTDTFIAQNQTRLAESYTSITACLKEHNIPFVEGGGAGFFVMLSLRRYLRSDSWEAELELWDILVKQCGVIFSAGASMHCHQPGWFRCCFTAYDAAAIVKRLTEMVHILNAKFPDKASA